MSIDWITVIAQIANFLLLVWLLKRFLYRPILDGIDAREAEISRRMGEAGEAQKKAQQAEDDFLHQRSQMLAEQNEKVEQALAKSADERDALLADARTKLEQQQKDWHSHLDRERHRFVTRLHHSGSETLLELTRKALRDLADESLEDVIVRHVGARLQPLADELTRAAGDNKQATASSRDALPEAAQQQLREELADLLPDMSLRFVTDPQQSPGLVLRIGGAQVAWTVDSYIDEFDALLDERLAAGASGRS